jgi:hypothetical protein
MVALRKHIPLLFASCLMVTTLWACGNSDEPASPQAEAAPQQPAAAQPPPPAPVSNDAPEPLEASGQQWSPEAMEELLAPVALYPDAVLYQVLIASTNPQEVLDAGNWLIANPDLAGKALDEAAETAGFTPPTRALVQFPQVVDNMCLNLDWTEEVGQAYVNDQPGVQQAVQRLRRQAESVGNLESSDYMTVTNETQNGQQTVIIQPADPQVIYVPQYDPNAVYTQQSATSTTTTTTSVEQGYDTTDLVVTGLFAFGAGMIVNEIFDDDDDWYDHHHYGWYGPAPYYPPYAYRPRYGGGFYPHHNYNRPNRYVRDNTVIINRNNNNDYYDRFNKGGGYNKKRAPARSPITAARPDRQDLARSTVQARPTRVEPRTSTVKGTYAGARPGGGGTKVQGSYASKKRAAASRPPDAKVSRPNTGAAKSAARDRGYTAAGARPAGNRNAGTGQRTGNSSTAFSGAKNSSRARAAADRGRKSGAGKNLRNQPRAKRR